MLAPDGDRSAYLSARAERLRARMVASPWVRVVAGPRRGFCYRDVGTHQIWALGDFEKHITDKALRERGFRVHDAPAGCIIE